MDVGEKIDEVLLDPDQRDDMHEFNEYIHCLLMDRCGGESYEQIKGLQTNTGAGVYMIVYRWFTEISGLGLSMQVTKLMNPEPTN